MLGTRDRRLLLEALRPPDGYAFSEAVGTTFTLDLMALLTAPLAFTLFDWQDAEGKPQADPLALLEALRRHADHVHVFCQAGYVSVPAPDQRLLGWLEGSVIEVRRPEDRGPFHPKVWVLRFTSDASPVRYRVLVGTRNLTFDRSWDTLLVLEGDVRAGGADTREGPALADFLSALPRLALHAAAAKRASSAIEHIVPELRRTKFIAPEPFEGFRFLPLGEALWGALGVPPKKQPRWPGFGECRVDRLLVVSPFLSPSTLREMPNAEEGSILVSREESLMEVPAEILGRFGTVYALSPEAEVEAPEGEGEAIGLNRLGGLHAKLYVADQGWDATVWTGSPNASGSLKGAGVEMLVELWGKKSNCGIDAILDGADGRGALRGLLTAYLIPAGDGPGDAVKRQLEQQLDEVRAVVAQGGLAVLVVPEREVENRYRMRLVAPSGALVGLPAGTEILVRPITRARGAALRWPSEPGGGVDFGQAAFEGLTTFIAFQATVRIDGRSLTDEFVLNLPSSGMPSNRRERMLQSALRDRGQVLRFLLLLLSDGGLDARDLVRAATAESGKTDQVGALGVVEVELLEEMLRALERDPQKLDRIERFVEDLGKSPEGEKLLPLGLRGLLEPILEARRSPAP